MDIKKRLVFARKKMFNLSLCLIIGASLMLTACGDSFNNSLFHFGKTDENQEEEPYGKPWVTSIVMGNLPKSRPSVKDDLYTHYNYEYLKNHQSYEDFTEAISDVDEEVKKLAFERIKDNSRKDKGLEQMRILYEQAADRKKLEEIGMSELQPYLDMIDSAETIEELNNILISDDFPFNPFLKAVVSVGDKNRNNIVSLMPNYIVFDPVTEGGLFYKDCEDPEEQEAMDEFLNYYASYRLLDIQLLGISEDDIDEAMENIISFERSYGKYTYDLTDYTKMDYGEFGKLLKNSYFSLDEVSSLCSNMPIKEMLQKCKKDMAEYYYIDSPDCLSTLNTMWTTENLSKIKLAAKAKLLTVTRSFRDMTLLSEKMVEFGLDPLKDEDAIYAVLSNGNTFDNLLAEYYVDETFGEEGVERLKKLTSEIVDAYKELVDDTKWMSEASKKRLIEKLDNMSLNILKPEKGYMDYNDLVLVPTSEGGTLFSNYLRLVEYKNDYESKIIGKPAAGDILWYAVSPLWENCFYDQMSNSINILPGYVAPSIYSNDMDDMEVLSGIGFVIGHEISHGFDYTGAQLDADGLANNIFSEEDVNVFLEKCDRIADYYSTMEYRQGKFVDGRSQVVEAAADLSSMQICLLLASRIEDMDYDAFWEKFASRWAGVIEYSSLDAAAKEGHPLTNLRINIAAQMCDELYDTYEIEEGDGMYLAPEKRIVLWGSDS